MLADTDLVGEGAVLQGAAMGASSHGTANGLVDEPGEGLERPASGLLAVAVLSQPVQEHALGHTRGHCTPAGARQGLGRQAGGSLVCRAARHQLCVRASMHSLPA